MGVTRYYNVKAHGDGIEIDFIYIVQDIKKFAIYFDNVLGRELRGPCALIDIAPHSTHIRYRRETANYFNGADVSCMDDEIGSFKNTDCFITK